MGVLLRRGRTCEGRHGEGHVTMEVEIGVWSREPRIGEAKRKAWDRFSPRTFKRTWPCRHLDFGLPASRAVREQTAVVLSPPVGGALFSSPRKRTQRTKQCFLSGEFPAHRWPASPVGEHSRFSLQVPVHITDAASAKLCAREIREKTFYLREHGPQILT